MSYIGGASSNDYSEVSLYGFVAGVGFDGAMYTGDGFVMLEKESSLRVEAVMRQTDMGVGRVCAYKVTARLVIPNNSYSLYKWMFDELRSGSFSDMFFAFRRYNRSTGKMIVPPDQNYDAPSVAPSETVIGTFNLSMGATEWFMETIEYRPRMVVNIVAYVAPDIFDEQGDLETFWSYFEHT